MRLMISSVMAVLIMIFFSSTARARYVLDTKMESLVDCSHVMAYAVNYALMTNNEGLARVLIFQSARASTALMAKNYVNGVVPQERTRAWDARSQINKKYLDTKQANLSNIVNSCYPIIQQAVDDPIVRSSILWGKNFTELVELMAEKLRTQYGLR